MREITHQLAGVKMKPTIVFVFALLTSAALLSIAEESHAQNINAFGPSEQVSAIDMLTSYDCTRLSDIDTVYRVEYDVHRPTGNLLAVVVRSGDGYMSSLSVFFSSNNGQSWYWTCNLPKNYFIHDVACAVYEDDFIVVYTEYNSIKALRFSALNGNNINFESGAQTVTVLASAESSILELELESTQYHYYSTSYDYCLAALSGNNRVYFFRSDAVAEFWMMVDMPVTNADHGLDLALHEENGQFSWPYSMYISFIEDDDEMSVYGYYNRQRWDRLLYKVIGPTEPFYTSLAAYGGHVYCFAETNIAEKGVTLYVSHDDGESWTQTGFHSSDAELCCPDITIRSGSCLAYTLRVVISNPPIFSKEGRIICSAIDQSWSTPSEMCSPSPYIFKPSLELTSSGQYGILYIKSTDTEKQVAYFCRAGNCCHTGGDANNDGNCNIGDAVFVNNYVFVPNNCDTNPPSGCSPRCPSEGDANSDGTINIGDAVYLLNYVFKSSQCDTNPPIGCAPECN